jgi:hypothetical protein
MFILLSIRRRTTSHSPDEPKMFSILPNMRDYGNADTRENNNQMKANVEKFMQVLEQKGLASMPLSLPNKKSKEATQQKWASLAPALRSAIQMVRSTKKSAKKKKAIAEEAAVVTLKMNNALEIKTDSGQTIEKIKELVQVDLDFLYCF